MIVSAASGKNPKQVFWLEDAAYIADIQKLGFRAAYLDDLKVLRAGGPYYSPTPPREGGVLGRLYRRIARKGRRQALPASGSAARTAQRALPLVPAAGKP